MAEAMDVTELLQSSNDKKYVRSSSRVSQQSKTHFLRSRADLCSLRYSRAITVPKEIPVELDLGLLAVFDPNPLEEEEYA